MTDPLASILGQGEPTSNKQLIFQKNFLSNKQFVGVPYDKMPKMFRQEFDSFVVSALDVNSGKIIVTGSSMVGKTFFIQQLYYNRDVFTKRAGLDKLEFVNVTFEHALLVAQNTPGRWTDYVELAMNVYGARLESIIFVTESLDAAVGITRVGGRVILEASPQIIHNLSHQESSGMIKQWNSWEIIDLNSIYLSKASMVEMLAQAHLDSLNIEYPNINLTRKHIAQLVDYSARYGELIIDSEMSKEYAGRLLVQPGIMANALFRFASNLAFDDNMRNSRGELVYSRAIKDTFQSFEGQFFNCLRDFVEFVDNTSINDDDDDETARAIKEILESQMPGVQIVNVARSGGKQKNSNQHTELEFSDISTLKERLKKSVLGQDDAIETIVNGLKVTAAGLNSDNKPLRSLMFLGPTGVGKTQLSLSLAKELMTEEIPVKRIDMSEYASSHEAAKLIGSPPGYVGHEAGGVLTNFVKDNPRSVVIFDEVEKAHPKVWDNFLQLLDAGRLTDSHGETIDFTKTVIIMTSNLGAKDLKNGTMGFGLMSESEAYAARVADANKIVRRAVEEEFRPELVNRFDQLVVFNELPKDIIRQVVAKEISETSKKLEERGYELSAPKVDILDYIAGLSDVSKYGAREIQRVVGTNVLQILAEEVLANKDKKKLTLTIKDGGLSVKARVGKKHGESQE